VVIQAKQGGGDEEDEAELKQSWKFGRNEGPMTWPWKLCCAILYMLPWVDVTEKTVYFIERFPAFHWTEYFTGKQHGNLPLPCFKECDSMLSLRSMWWHCGPMTGCTWAVVLHTGRAGVTHREHIFCLLRCLLAWAA